MQWVRDQVDTYERTGGREAGTLRETGIPVIIVSMRGATSGSVRKIALMRVEHEGEYALVASYGGSPQHPAWYHNLVAHPRIEVTWKNQRKTLLARLASPEEKAAVWPLCCQHYKDFDLYQRRTGRDIPVFICEPAGVA